MEEPFSSKWISKLLRKFYYVTNSLDLQISDNEKKAYLNFFEICTGMMRFTFSLLSYYNLTFKNTFKCTGVHCFNLFRFFDFLFMFISTSFLSKIFMEKLSFFKSYSHVNWKSTDK